MMAEPTGIAEIKARLGEGRVRLRHGLDNGRYGFIPAGTTGTINHYCREDDSQPWDASVSLDGERGICHLSPEALEPA